MEQEESWLQEVEISREDLSEVMGKMKLGKTTGYDEVK